MSSHSRQTDSNGNLVSTLISKFTKGCSRCNVGQAERLVSLALGGTLAWAGLRRKSLGGLCLAAVGGSLVYRGVTGWCQLYNALHISTAELAPQASLGPGEGFKVEKSITVERTADELYLFWRNLSNLPYVFQHIKSIRVADSTKSHWTIRGPLNSILEWDAELIEDHPGKLIAWRSLEGSDVSTAGSVHFRSLPDMTGTEVQVVLRYSPSGGCLGRTLAQWFGEFPERQIESELEDFKKVMERQDVSRGNQAGQSSSGSGATKI
ncbi:MAG: hypothetical protein JWM11_5646 [Planctomycetaceae bacterium]|nr:hypothetical protein [Planctomycetaceae bacterium]